MRHYSRMTAAGIHNSRRLPSSNRTMKLVSAAQRASKWWFRLTKRNKVCQRVPPFSVFRSGERTICDAAERTDGNHCPGRRSCTGRRRPTPVFVAGAHSPAFASSGSTKPQDILYQLTEPSRTVKSFEPLYTRRGFGAAQSLPLAALLSSRVGRFGEGDWTIA